MGKPRLIIIIRHAQSEGNRDKTIHQKTPDHKVGLTEEGHRQALEAGEKLRALLRTDDTLHFFISPYRRTRETTEGILNGLCANDPVPSPFQRSHIKVYEEPRLREQDFGNFQPGTEETERLWRERAEYGHFFYRIPNGESGADVYDRVSSFNGSLWRRFSEDSMASVAILVTHGLCSRVFLMAWYHYSVEFFEDLRNINHCEFLVMKHGPNGRYVLQNQLRRWSDLRRERAAARKNSLSAPPESIPTIPVRRWTQSKSAHDPTGASFIPRPTRKNTADMFRDEPEMTEGGGDDKRTPNASPTQRRRSRGLSATRERSRTRVRSSSNLRNSFSNLSVDTGRKGSNLVGVKSYLGRDGGGTRSGQGSPFGSDDELEVESPGGTSQTAAIQALSSSPETIKKSFSGSLARALRGELDDPNRKLADALGDQSDAEVDEADLEIGTKERVTGEMEQILEDERRERSQAGSAYTLK
ncbi:phosphoglycerate mutase [Cladophialophora carrionii]|uniref:Phosphoglycerate mutase n=1 Tax=Cladophialophora carrionii TaxID=86049 RepID=A0A1C1CEE5_9EURO|nr:phosphoglycerate mutase [Cladophialophora carrionii]